MQEIEYVGQIECTSQMYGDILDYLKKSNFVIETNNTTLFKCWKVVKNKDK